MNDLSRQSFLGADSDAILRDTEVVIVGLCGGGSHVAQQLAHLGVGRFVLCDPDVVEETNLNRMVGASLSDAQQARAKVEVIAAVMMASKSLSVRMRGVPMEDALQYNSASHSKSSRRSTA